jgi:ACS family hexuronate transporter-like MFS transporter
MTDDLFRKTILGLSPGAVFSEQNLQDFRIQMGWIDSAFKATYAIGFLLAGWMIDKIGAKRGFSLGMLIWSAASVLSTFCVSAGQFRWVRAMLGLGESTNFPASMKVISVWFPKAERSTATGILNAGSNMGIIVTAVLIPFLVLQFGWRYSFFVSALLGVTMLLIWRFSYSEPNETPALSAEELQHISGNTPGEISTPSEPQLSWGKLLRYRQTWAFIFGKIFADPVWFFYLTWLPDFLSTNQQLDRKLDLKNFGIPFLIIYLVSDLGSIFFGWLATRLMQKGWSENAARKLTLLICGSLVLPIWFIPSIHSFNLIVAMFALAMAAHQGWSTNIYALATTLFPKNSVGSATGLGGFLGGSISMAVAAGTGYVVAYLGYRPMFIFACSFYLIGLACIHLTLPVLKKIELQ